ncbi:ligase-associated DNA damage response endonuclease PdeM [Flavobacterium circumlabens]|uniref:Ligase-associated DNA damage response endonuclease PdeM n=1 Tax=Flavobacterium circumlabens TaxID=2133765 RepID=A0A4Y7UAP8_9FLAO|nr:ligase-associated DNA damage response endonuclease PdeM [Flavobacterium circumlabens]TCN54717.1 putative phosphoesterase [Flavobacterium circumlabens]TEB42909.1 ligase-associated DNA damage response endonuclease PdeM [Flavobacterium circumlabens]
MKITIQDQTFVLHPTGALFWEDKKWLLISDVHLGKVSHFRKHGVAVPNNAILENFSRLTKVAEFFSPEKVIFLGDLFHSSINQEWDLFEEWVSCCVSEITLIAGNHDIINKKHYTDIHIEVLQFLEVDGFLLTHHPKENKGWFNFSGHIHPGVTLRGLGGQSLKLPCFFQKENQMILPAFGEFTGKHMMRPEQGDLIYAIAMDEIVIVNSK